jgi:hypothetical protein
MKLSGLLYFCAGVAAGAAGRAAYPKLKETIGPLAAAALQGAQEALNDAISEAARTVGEQAGAVQDTGAGVSPEAARNGAAAAAAPHA